jgi:hypothetical protein
MPTPASVAGSWGGEQTNVERLGNNWCIQKGMASLQVYTEDGALYVSCSSHRWFALARACLQGDGIQFTCSTYPTVPLLAAQGCCIGCTQGIFSDGPS